MVHLVHFWLKEEYKTEEGKKKFEQALTALCKDCPLASSSKWGRPAKVMERPVVDLSWDYNLVTYFDTPEIQNDYQTCPIHLTFIDDCKDMWEKVLVMDAELEE